MTLYREKICVISSSRAEYGLLKNLLCQIKKSKKLKLQLIVTGTHLSVKHGLTYHEIISDNLKIDKKIKILKNSDTSLAISNYLSDGIKKFSKTYFKIKPDLIFILGDKFETRLHFRVVPVDEQNKWLAWTGYKQTMLDDEEDEGLWDIYNDRHKKLTMKFSN